MTRRPEKQTDGTCGGASDVADPADSRSSTLPEGVAALFGIVASARLALFPPRLSLQHEPSLPRCGRIWQLRAMRSLRSQLPDVERSRP